MPQFSIIIPVYNVENYLRQCLDSVLAQTFPDYECILVDDGSPDNCPAICDEYAEKYSRFIVIHKKNGGLSDARNVGIQAASGEYIVLLDSDDLFADTKALENLGKTIETAKTDIIFNSNLTTFNVETFTSSDKFNKNFIFGDTIDFYKEIMRNRSILLAGCFFVVHREFLLQHDLFFKTGILHEDEHWMPRVLCASQKIAVNHNLFYAYRTERLDSIMADVTPKRCFDQISTIEDISEWVKNQGLKSNQYQIIYKDRCIILWTIVFDSINLLGIRYQQERIQLLKKLRKNSHVLLYRISRRNYILYLLILFIGSNFTRYLFTLKAMKCYISIKLYIKKNLFQTKNGISICQLFQ